MHDGPSLGKIRPVTASNRLKQIDRQILDLLAERLELAESDTEDDDTGENEDNTDTGASDLEWWIEEGAERGIDDATVEKLYKVINAGEKGE